MVWRHPLIQTSSQSGDLIFLIWTGSYRVIYILCANLSWLGIPTFISQRKYYPAGGGRCHFELHCWGGFKFLVHRAVWCYRCLEVSGPLVWCYWWHPPHSIRHKLARKSSLDRCCPASTSNLLHFWCTSYLPHFWSTTITFSDPPSLHQILPKEKATTCLK